jgi:hypothetical protein
MILSQQYCDNKSGSFVQITPPHNSIGLISLFVGNGKIELFGDDVYDGESDSRSNR